MEKIFDSHAHYTDERFAPDREALLNSLFQGPVGWIMNCSVTYADAQAGLALARQWPNLYLAAGIHPENVCESCPEDLTALRELYCDPKVAAIGEIGLDYHWDTPKDLQRFYFEQQLKAALETDMPVIVHDREAHADTWELLKQYHPKGVVHCFSGSAESARELVKLGMYIGFTGAITFPGSKKPLEAIAAVPLERLLLETDCPYMAPVPQRGQRCDSGMIAYTAAKMAEVKGVATDELLRITAENAARLFGLDL